MFSIKSIKNVFSENQESDKLQIELGESISYALAWMGLWPNKKSDLLKSVCTEFVLELLFVGFLGHFLKFLSNNSFDFLEVADDVTVGLAVLSTSYYRVLYLYYHNDLKSLLRDMGDFSKYEKPKGIERVNNMFNFGSKMATIWICASCVLVFIILIFQNCEEGDESVCGFLFTAYLPYVKIYETPMRQIYMTIQCISGYSTCLVSLQMTWIFMLLNEIAVTYIRHLKYMFKGLPFMSSRKARKERLQKNVQYHQHIFRLIERIKLITRNMYMLCITACSMFVSLASYQLLRKGFLYSSFVHLMTWVLSTSVCCLFGERITSESVTIPFVVYENIPWDGDLETQKDMLFIIMRGNIDITLQAGKFGKLNHALLLAIMKTSYSYLALLYNTS